MADALRSDGELKPLLKMCAKILLPPAAVAQAVEALDKRTVTNLADIIAGLTQTDA